jgi:ribosome-associated protein
MKIRVTGNIEVDESEIEERFVLSTGPGGQNVNKVASAVELRFDVQGSHSLPEPVRQRLAMLAGRRLTKEGVLVLRGQRFRDQLRNREDVRRRLFALICEAAILPKARKRTKPTRASKERRLEEKKARSRLKQLRSRGVE